MIWNVHSSKWSTPKAQMFLRSHPQISMDLTEFISDSLNKLLKNISEAIAYLFVLSHPPHLSLTFTIYSV